VHAAILLIALDTSAWGTNTEHSSYLAGNDTGVLVGAQLCKYVPKLVLHWESLCLQAGLAVNHYLRWFSSENRQVACCWLTTDSLLVKASVTRNKTDKTTMP